MENSRSYPDFSILTLSIQTLIFNSFSSIFYLGLFRSNVVLYKKVYSKYINVFLLPFINSGTPVSKSKLITVKWSNNLLAIDSITLHI